MYCCHNCQAEIEIARPGRRDTCPRCDADLRCCCNCAFYEPGAHNDCREPQSDSITDREQGNFCDYFTFRDTGPGASGGGRAPQRRNPLDDLFT